MTNIIDFQISKFRNKSGVRLLKALFLETNRNNKDQILYTLKEIDWKGFPSLYRLYIEIEDLTEYQFAIKCLESWDHWLVLCETEWFKPYISRWRDELKLKIASEALQRIKTEARDDESKNSFQANKILIDRPWEKNRGVISDPPSTNVNGRGRPSKQEVQNELKRAAQEERELEEDLERITRARDG
jgi:hypothetical protein